MTVRTNRCLIIAAIICLVIGLLLSHLVGPGVSVRHVTLAGETPALQFIPSDAKPHSIALLAHGVTASKETLFCIGEALAAAGFVCYAVDLPGHGQSPHPFGRRRSNVDTLEQVAKELRSVDVYIGHSMGAYAGGQAVRGGGFSPRLFIAIGASPELGGHGPPLLILSGQLDEAIPQSFLKERTDTRVQLFAGCDHALEPYDPRLVNAAVEAACSAVGKTPPPSPIRWMWRLAGTIIGLLSTLGLLLLLPKLPPLYALLRGLLVALIFIAALVFTTSTWFGVTPNLRRAPQQVVIIIMAVLVVAGAGKLRIPRLVFAIPPAAAWIGFLMIGAYFLGLIAMLAAITTIVGAILGWIAAHNGLRRDGDIAMAIFVGYAAGQCLPTIF